MSNKLPNKNFCIIPWIHLNTWPNGNVFQCCITDYRNHIGNLRDNSIKEIWNNDYMKNLRQELLDDKQPSSCHKCYEQEANGIKSFRNAANRNFNNHMHLAEKTKDDGSTDFNLIYWDFRFSNLCNMKCRMCGGHLSSMWNKDELDLYGKASEPEIVVNTKDHSIDDLYQILDEQIDYVEEIYFAGGEPLIMDEHYYILEKLIERKRFNVRLRYNTNLLKLEYKKWNNVELWKHFDNVHVISSLDALGDRAEYIRKGTVWNTVEANARTLLKQPNILFGISPTINIFNIEHVPDFVQYMLDMGVTYDKMHLNNVLTNPPWYHIKILPKDIKQRIRQKFENHIVSIQDTYTQKDINNKYTSILNFLDHECSEKELSYLRKKFKRVTGLLDNYRQEKFVDIVPEFKDFYEGIDE